MVLGVFKVGRQCFHFSTLKVTNDLFRCLFSECLSYYIFNRLLDRSHRFKLKKTTLPNWNNRLLRNVWSMKNSNTLSVAEEFKFMVMEGLPIGYLNILVFAIVKYLPNRQLLHRGTKNFTAFIGHNYRYNDPLIQSFQLFASLCNWIPKKNLFCDCLNRTRLHQIAVVPKNSKQVKISDYFTNGFF